MSIKNIDTWAGYDVWKCTPPEPEELSDDEAERLDEIIVDMQNEAVMDNGWDLLDESQRDEALLYLRQHQALFEEQALSQLRGEIKKKLEAARDPF